MKVPAWRVCQRLGRRCNNYVTAGKVCGASRSVGKCFRGECILNGKCSDVGFSGRIFSMFFCVFEHCYKFFGRFWKLSDLGFDSGNDPKRQVFLERLRSFNVCKILPTLLSSSSTTSP